MSFRSRSQGGNGPPTSNPFAARRQERMRGAGNHAIMQRNYQFINPTRRNGRQSSSTTASSSSITSTPIQRAGVRGGGEGSNIESSPAPNYQQSQGSTSLLERDEEEMTVASMSPAMSLRSGRGVFPSSSPSKYIDPRLLADQSHHRLRSTTQSPSANAKPIEQRRQERMRGAGIHKIESKSYRFNRRSSGDASSIANRSSGLLDSVMSNSIGNKGSGRDPMQEQHNNMQSWIEQRRMERRRGAGTHSIEKRNIAFGPLSTRFSDASNSTLYESILEERDEEGELDNAEVDDSLAEANQTILANDYSDPMQSTPTGAGRRLGQHVGVNSLDHQEIFNDDVTDLPHLDDDDLDMDINGNMDSTESPGSKAAERAMNKRKAKRQASPRRTVQRKAKKTNSNRRSRPMRRVIDLAADETIVGQADLTMEEQREAAFIAPEPPTWTFPKKPVTTEELLKMKNQVKEVITLALGNEAGVGPKVKFNDADVLWVEIKRALQAQQQSQGRKGIIQRSFEQLLDSLLETFTHLSQQSAERSRLIFHLQQARRRNLTIRKQLFKKRSHVLQIARTMQVLKNQEMQRIQIEEDEEKSIDFLNQLQQVSHEWC